MRQGGVIVLGYDGSDGADAALEEVIAMAAAFGDRVLVTFGYGAIPAGGETKDQELVVQQFGREAGEAAVARLREAGVDAELLLVHGRPSESLLEVAVARGARLIAVGSRGTGPFLGSILGSVTYKLVHRSTIPVLVCPVRG